MEILTERLKDRNLMEAQPAETTETLYDGLFRSAVRQGYTPREAEGVLHKVEDMVPEPGHYGAYPQITHGGVANV